MDESRAYYTKSERQISYINVYMESRKMVPMHQRAGSNGDANIENGLVDTVGKGPVGPIERVARKQTSPYVK